MRPKSKGSSTMGVKKSVVATRAWVSLRRYTAASSAVSVPTRSSGGSKPAGTRPISSARTAGAILQPHPPPWENCVSLMASMEIARIRAGQGNEKRRGDRSTALVQSALLEVMQERQVTIAGETHKVPSPFVVMATQNPIETEGTYPLPEAQVDRFMMKVLVGYPSDDDEFVIVERVIGAPVEVSPVCSTGQLAELQQVCRGTYVDPGLIGYAVKLVGATRRPADHGLPEIAKYLSYGASPRASIAMIEAGRALAFLRGRNYVLP